MKLSLFCVSQKFSTTVKLTGQVETSEISSFQDDVEEEGPMIDDRDSRISGSREDRDSPPRCQGCLERAAQFVCAGCGNQWYCSRECQVLNNYIFL